MSQQDPYYTVRDDIRISLKNMQILQQKWKQLISVNSPSAQAAAQELQNSVQNIEWDLQDIEQSISVVEKNPSKFNISLYELNERKEFLNSVKATCREVTRLLSVKSDNRDPLQFIAKSDGGNNFIENETFKQQVIMKKQDEQLDSVMGTISVLKEQSRAIGKELDEQAILLDDMDRNLDMTGSKLDRTKKRLDALYQATTKDKTNCTIVCLIIILIALIIVLATT